MALTQLEKDILEDIKQTITEEPRTITSLIDHMKDQWEPKRVKKTIRIMLDEGMIHLGDRIRITPGPGDGLLF